jgi:hypothetical protein
MTVWAVNSATPVSEAHRSFPTLRDAIPHIWAFAAPVAQSPKPEIQSSQPRTDSRELRAEQGEDREGAANPQPGPRSPIPDPRSPTPDPHGTRCANATTLPE